MPSAVSDLIATRRQTQRPRWSQQFLADELQRLGYPATREQIARLERSEPLRANPELIAAVTLALGIEADALRQALFEDFHTVESSVAARLGGVVPIGAPERVPLRFALARR